VIDATNTYVGLRGIGNNTDSYVINKVGLIHNISLFAYITAICVLGLAEKDCD